MTESTPLFVHFKIGTFKKRDKEEAARRPSLMAESKIRLWAKKSGEIPGNEPKKRGADEEFESNWSNS